MEATSSLAMDCVCKESPEDADLLNLCSFLSPDDIPIELTLQGTKHIPEPLATASADRLAMNMAIKILRQYSLI